MDSLPLSLRKLQTLSAGKAQAVWSGDRLLGDSEGSMEMGSKGNNGDRQDEVSVGTGTWIVTSYAKFPFSLEPEPERVVAKHACSQTRQPVSDFRSHCLLARWSSMSD